MEVWFSRADGDRKREETPPRDPLPGKTARHHRREDDFEYLAPLKTIHVDSSTLLHKKYPSFTLPPPSPPPPPPLPPSPSQVAKVKWGTQRRKDSSVPSLSSFTLPPPSPPPPPPPLPPSPSPVVKIKRSRHRSKNSSIMYFPSFGSHKKEIKEKKKGSAAEIQGPPPLPPPPSLFRNLFANLKKEAKMERIKVHSVSIPPPPPPPPTTPYPRKSTSEDATSGRKKEKTRKENANSRESSIIRPSPLPPLAPVKGNYGAYTFRRNNSGGGWFTPPSPLPPPPFLIFEQNTSTPSKYIKNRTQLDTGFESTVEQKQGREEGKGEDGDGGRPASFCQSPDVNVKAERFIARIREGIRLEQMQSLRDRKEREAMKLENSGTDSVL